MPPRKVKSKSNPKKTMLIVGVVAVILVVAGVVAYGPIKRHQQAQHDVDVLLLCVNGYSREHGKYPNGSYATICKLLQGQSVEGQNSNHLDYIEAASYEFNKNGEIIDPWGMPYHISFEGALTIYSAGPNKIDEQGHGDDIVAVPNPSVASN